MSHRLDGTGVVLLIRNPDRGKQAMFAAAGATVDRGRLSVLEEKGCRLRPCKPSLWGLSARQGLGRERLERLTR